MTAKSEQSRSKPHTLDALKSTPRKSKKKIHATFPSIVFFANTSQELLIFSSIMSAFVVSRHAVKDFAAWSAGFKAFDHAALGITSSQVGRLESDASVVTIVHTFPAARLAEVRAAFSSEAFKKIVADTVPEGSPVSIEFFSGVEGL
jgi:hypothetical protein